MMWGWGQDLQVTESMSIKLYNRAEILQILKDMSQKTSRRTWKNLASTMTWKSLKTSKCVSRAEAMRLLLIQTKRKVTQSLQMMRKNTMATSILFTKIRVNRQPLSSPSSQPWSALVDKSRLLMPLQSSPSKLIMLSCYLSRGDK